MLAPPTPTRPMDLSESPQPAHKPRKRGADGYGHERIDKLVVERYRSILEPSSNAEEQEALHRDDEDTTWFGIGRDHVDGPVFEDYGRFAALMQDSLPKPGAVRHPQLISFIGQTGAGKSTVVKMLINHQDLKTNQTLRSRYPAPLPGSVNDNVPVSANVHLYADPDSYQSTTPILYADCEGLEGGESIPRAEAFRVQDGAVNLHAQRKDSLDPKGRRRLHRKGNRVSRNLKWAHGDKEKSKREYAVTELYPKLLYTFSDVVVFVLRNPKYASPNTLTIYRSVYAIIRTFESAVLTKLVGWASASFEKSLGQPALPHIIIALNATDLAIDASQWDVEEATNKLLSSVESAINTIPILQDHVAWWRANGRVVHTTKDLLECYYSSVTVVRIPMKGRYMLIDQQVEKLHTQIMMKGNQSHYKKRKVGMLSDSEDLQLYLQLAFDHFSQDLDTPFDFVSIALKINPIPSDFGGNILKLAVSIKNRYRSWRVVEIFEQLSLMVASCIMLDIHRHRRLGHQTAQGKVIESGDYVPSFHYQRDLRQWIQCLEKELAKIEGGMRGIVELEILKAIERQLPAGVPIRSFFDLIIGTSTGGLIALGLGIEGWSTQTCIKNFERLCDTAFTPRELHKIPVLGKLEVINNDYARYKAKPFEKILQESFSVSEQPLFGGQYNNWQSSVRTAVTATSETGDQAVLLSNYNRSHDKDDRCKCGTINSEIEIDKPRQPHTGLKGQTYLKRNSPYGKRECFENFILPSTTDSTYRARATSAAPTYFKSFRSARNDHGYLDGALYHNNPVRVADLERRLIWPETEDSTPDLLLSIGTSCNDAINDAVQRSAGLLRQRKPAMGPNPSSTVVSGPRRIFTRRHKKSQPRKWFNILVNRIENILDTELTWQQFMAESGRGDELNRSRYHRINPNIGEDPPRLDDTKKLPHLRQRMVHVMKEKTFQNQIGEVARRLVASSFYVEVPAKSRNIRRLGDYLKNVSTLKFKPHFIFTEQKSSGREPQQILITSKVIESMMMNASFCLETVHIPVSNENAVITGNMSLASDEYLPISGFPRTLAPRKTAKGKFNDLASRKYDNSSQQSEGSNTAFPEIQQLPKESKMLIWRFVHEKIEALTNRDEEVPAKMSLIERACDVDSEEDEDAPGISSGNGPYGTVLHTACAIGNNWIVEMQIKARVDLTTLDDHCWTALMVAEVQGHAACSKILCDYLEEIGANIFADPLPPTGLADTELDSPVFVDGEYFKALPGFWQYEFMQKRIHVRANHPISPKKAFFYFEMSIIGSGPLGIMGIGLCRPGTDVLGMPGWHPSSWGYHGDDGMKYHGHEGMKYHKHNGEGLKYSEKCFSRKMEYTLVRISPMDLKFEKLADLWTEGIAFRNVTGILYPMIGFGEKEAEALVNFGARPFHYHIHSHRWGSEDQFVDLDGRWPAASSVALASRPAPGGLAELA
ncbi:MAG: hypothetical protein Q9172_006425 [Xanthocarpia lactea]